MEVEITFSDDGNTKTIHVASLLYDLWEDYLFYRREAQATDRAADPLRYKRCLRGAVLAFFAYFEGVLNEWVAQIAPKEDLEKTSFASKLGIIRRKVGNDRRVPWLDVKRARAIRNTITHVNPATSDVDVMDTLLEGQFFRDADQFVNWMDLASHSLKLERHPDVSALLKELSKQ